jgi:hypothetical protein
MSETTTSELLAQIEPARPRGAGSAAATGSARTGSQIERSARLTDRLIQRLRVSDPPERFQALATLALREALGVEAVAWVPASVRERVVVDGASAGLEPGDYRALVPASTGEPIRVLVRQVGTSAEFARVAVAALDSESGGGWLLALNPPQGRAFRGSELDLLQSSAALIGTQRANARIYADVKDLLFGIVRALTSAIDAKDPYTSGHSERVARIAVRLGQELKLDSAQRGDLYLMGLLHDIGKIGIEDGVLKKTSRLTDEEYRQIQEHVRIGVHILSDLKKLQHLLPGVAHHHECVDGSGYPSGLTGEAIPLAARILAVADAYDAMSSSRPYRRRLSPDQIDEIFRNGAGSQWDSRVVAALFACRADVEGIRSKGLGESLRRAVHGALDRNELTGAGY